MIFADIKYEQHYSYVHDDLVRVLASEFSTLEHGLQGDSWIWIYEDDEKVEIDTFYSMKHQIKSSVQNGNLVQKVIKAVSSEFEVDKYHSPEPEPHE